MSVHIGNYSERSFYVNGDTLAYREGLRNIGGRWNKYLKDKESNQFSGWIFSKNHLDKVVDYFKARHVEIDFLDQE